MTKRNFKKAFTLVELIIVIAIIAILAVLSFLLLTKRLGNARDASRSSNLASIDKALQIYLTEKGNLPMPDNYALIYADAESKVIGYQGDFGETVKESIGDIDKAPKDGTDYFLYYLNNDLKSYQLGALMENETSYNQNTANAQDYNNRHIKIIGNEQGLLLDEENNPINRLGFTGIDIAATTGTYSAYFNDTDKLTGTGQVLKSLRGGGTLGYRLVSYWDFDNIGGGDTVYDIEKYPNNGVLTGTVYPELTGGKVGSGLYFGGSGYVQTTNTYSGLNNFSIALRINVLDKNRGYAFMNNGAIRPHIDPADGALSFRSWRNNVGGTQLRDEYPINTGNRIFFVGVEDNEYLNTYINGTLYKRYKKTGVIAVGDTSPLVIGHDSDGGGGYYRYTVGIMDDVRIYDRALSATEILSLYNATK